jgi:hypothetical protein
MGVMNNKAKRFMQTNTDHNAQNKALPLWRFDKNPTSKVKSPKKLLTAKTAPPNKARPLA